MDCKYSSPVFFVKAFAKKSYFTFTLMVVLMPSP